MGCFSPAVMQQTSDVAAFEGAFLILLWSGVFERALCVRVWVGGLGQKVCRIVNVRTSRPLHDVPLTCTLNQIKSLHTAYPLTLFVQQKFKQIESKLV